MSASDKAIVDGMNPLLRDQFLEQLKRQTGGKMTSAVRAKLGVDIAKNGGQNHTQWKQSTVLDVPYVYTGAPVKQLETPADATETFAGFWQFVRDEPWTNGLTVAVGAMSGVFLGSLLAPGAFGALAASMGGALAGSAVVYARWRILKQASDEQQDPVCGSIWRHMANEPIKTLIVFVSGGLIVGILVRIAENYILGEAVSYAVEGNILEVASLLGGGTVSVILEYAAHRWWSCDEHWWTAASNAVLSFFTSTIPEKVEQVKEAVTPVKGESFSDSVVKTSIKYQSYGIGIL